MCRKEGGGKNCWQGTHLEIKNPWNVSRACDGEGGWIFFDEYGEQREIILIMAWTSLFTECFYCASFCPGQRPTWGVVRGHIIGWHEVSRGREDHMKVEKRWLQKLREYQALLLSAHLHLPAPSHVSPVKQTPSAWDSCKQHPCPQERADFIGNYEAEGIFCEVKDHVRKFA